jgi:chemotaxis protein CheC
VNEQTTIWNRLTNGFDSGLWLNITMKHVARGLSGMVGKDITNNPSQVQSVPIAQVATRAGDPEMATVGVYLKLESDLCGWAVLILPLAQALNLVDLTMGAPPGTATNLGPTERSALGETGNLMVSYFLNAVAKLAGTLNPLRPSSPAVAVDMMGAILNLMVTPVATSGDDVLIIETLFEDAARALQVRFWVSPDPQQLAGNGHALA